MVKTKNKAKQWITPQLLLARLSCTSSCLLFILQDLKPHSRF